MKKWIVFLLLAGIAPAFSQNVPYARRVAILDTGKIAFPGGGWYGRNNTMIGNKPTSVTAATFTIRDSSPGIYQNLLVENVGSGSTFLSIHSEDTGGDAVLGWGIEPTKASYHMGARNADSSLSLYVGAFGADRAASFHTWGNRSRFYNGVSVTGGATVASGLTVSSGGISSSGNIAASAGFVTIDYGYMFRAKNIYGTSSNMIGALADNGGSTVICPVGAGGVAVMNAGRTRTDIFADSASGRVVIGGTTTDNGSQLTVSGAASLVNGSLYLDYGYAIRGDDAGGTSKIILAATGDITGGTTRLQSSGSGGTVFMNAIGNIKAVLDTNGRLGIGIGGNPITSKLVVGGLPFYATNAAARAGGLTSGAMFYMATGAGLADTVVGYVP